MRVLIVDDEQPARDRLRQLLEDFSDCRILGDAEDGEQAIELIGQLHPDLVLLDFRCPAAVASRWQLRSLRPDRS